MPCRLVSVLAVVCFVSFCTPLSFPQAPPSADSYVTTSMPSANFGNSAILPVQSGTTSYLKLNLSAFPSHSKVAKATLRLYVDAVTSSGSFDVYAVTGNWSERGLTASNAPALGVSATGGQAMAISKASVNQFVLVDITPLVQGWLDGIIANQGVALALTSNEGSFAFDSKEASGHHPELSIVLGETTPLTVASVASSTSLGTTIAATGAPAAGRATTLGVQQNAPDAYIDNGTALQTQANFNIDGTGMAATLSATTYQLGGNPFVSMSGWMSQSTGYYAGASNTGDLNTFIGVFAGQQNTTGSFNTVIGAQANAANQTGNYNTIVGGWAGLNNTGTNNSFYGAYSGYSNTSGVNNMFFGTNSGHFNTSGNNNFFLGAGSGYNNTTGSNNTFLGYLSGQNADPTASNNLYIGSLGAASESGTTRIGDPSSQTAAYIAGVNGVATSSGVPVFIDSTGKLGTGGGSVNFSQVTGTVSSSQLAGTYNSTVSLTSSANSFAGGFSGSFTGNGSGLTNVPFGTTWPITAKSGSYSVQTSDFSTLTQPGKFLILSGTTSATFTLPNPPPSLNGSCVAIGNSADPGINSNANAFLTVSPNGVKMDTFQSGNSTTPTMPRHTAYMFCSDGTNYFRMGFAQNGVSEIGPWIKTADTGAQNAMQTTFRNGIDFGLGSGGDGSVIFLQPKFANTPGIVTLNVNGLGAQKVLKFGQTGLAPGDLNPNTLAVLIWNFNGSYWELVNPQTANGTVTAVTGASPLVSSGGTAPSLSCPTCVTSVVAAAPLASTGGIGPSISCPTCVVGVTSSTPIVVSGGTIPNISCPTCITSGLLTGTTGPIGGTALGAGTCTSGTAIVSGAKAGHPVMVSAADGSLPDALTILSAAVTTQGTVTVQLCVVAAVTPVIKTYNVATQ